MIGHYFSRTPQKGWFEKELGENIELQWFVYKAGPSLMEGLISGAIDLAYVGPSPTINAFLRLGGHRIAIISGACSGGSSLIVQGGDAFKTLQDFKGKKIGTPQLGNTQDVAARSFFKSNGFQFTLGRGDLFIIPTPNPEQLSLFQTKRLDGVWAIEPWASQLVLQGAGRVFFDESTLWPTTGGRYVTTHMIVSSSFLKEHTPLIKAFIKRHVELTDWIVAHPEEAIDFFAQEFKLETGFAQNKDVLKMAWKKLEFTVDPIAISLKRMAQNAFELGFLSVPPELDGIYDLHLLNEVLSEKSRPPL